MNDIETYNQLIEVIMNEDDESLSSFVITESEKDNILYMLGGDATLINYLYLFEEYLEQHDIYLFKGWDKAKIIGKPLIEKFWVTITLWVSGDVDLRGAKRVNDAMQQGDVRIEKDTNESGYYVQFMVLKRELDRIENENKDKIEKLSDDALEEL